MTRRHLRTRRATSLLAATALLGSGLLANAAAAPPGASSPPASYTTTDQGDGTYTVPLLNSDVPDVSVERVPAAENDEGRDIYYMISTTMHLSPGAPIMKSYDLVNWEIVNYVYDRISIADPASLRNGQNSYGAGQWASSLRYHDGTFYVVFNTNNLGGAILYRTTDIENGAWERLPLGRGLHDPSLFFDEADGGTPYIFYGSVSAVRLNDDLTEIVADYPNIFSASDYPGAPFIGGLLEGAQVFYIDGEYYIATITWPSGQGRQVVLFRSPELLGRYTSDSGENTYEARSGLNSDGFAQGSLVEVVDDAGESAWHGFFFRDTYPLGRIPALIPATWQDGWPTFGDDGVVTRGSTFDKLIELNPAEELLARQQSIVVSDDFANDAPHRPYMDEEWDIPGPPAHDGSLLGLELIDNGGFENGIEAWSINDTAEMTPTTDAASGQGAVHVTGRTTTGSGPLQDVTGKVQHGITYDISAAVKYDGPDSPSTKQFFITAHYGGSTYTNLGTGTVANGEWGEIAGSFTVPEGQSLQTMRIFVETPWTSDPAADPDVHLMDFTVDEVSLVGRELPEQPHEDEIAPNGSRLADQWQWNHSPDNRYWSLTDRDGWLRLTNGKVVTGDYVYTKHSTRDDLTYFEEARNTLSQRTFGPTASAETRIDVSGMRDGDVAGLAAYSRSFAYAAVKRVDGANVLGVVQRLQPFSARIDHEAVEEFVPGTTVDLGAATEVSIKADADFATNDGQLWLRFYYSLDGENWSQLGSSRAGPLVMDWSLSHFMGYRFGLFSYATQEVGGRVDFDHFLLSDTLTAAGEPLDAGVLDAAIDQAAMLRESDYPAEGWHGMQEALAAALQARAGTLSTQNQIDAPQRALSLELARLGVLAEAAPSLDVDVVGGTRCVAGRAVVTVRVTNQEPVAVSVDLESDWGRKSFPAVAPGKSAVHAFTTRQADLPAGSATAEVIAEGVSAVNEAQHGPASCS
ncbi:family 43 glycosylhydrolase [Georgenia sunbinii]|uniref:beta-xylosidase family glycoside hydrolase n=1 Tax=Georgenia sunbinii TaxID=3117728 RepID=UPI002F269FD4